jgi:cell division protein FtsB
VTNTPETQSEAEQVESTTPGKPSARNMISALAVFALGLNAAAAVYTSSPSSFVLPDISRVAELFPHQQAPAAAEVPATVVAALEDIQSAQRQHVAVLDDNRTSLQQHTALLQQSTALLQQDTTVLSSLRQSLTDERVDVKKISAQITDEHVDVRKMSAQISTLIAKVDTLQNTLAPEVTSSIPKGHARNRLSAMAHRKMARQVKPAGPISVGGAPLTVPAQSSAGASSPEG